MRIGSRETHPAADLFPLLEGEEFRALCESIRERGLEQPIELIDGLVLDGRNRLRACLEVEAPPRFVDWGGGDPFEHVWAHSALRRHLEPGQRAAIRLKVDAAISELAARRQTEANAARSAATKAQPRRDGKLDRSRAPVPATRGGDARRTRTELARRAEVSPRTAQKAITLGKISPVALDRVAAGEENLSAAYREATKRPPSAPPGVTRLAGALSQVDRTASNLQVRLSEVQRLLETNLDVALVGLGAWTVFQRLELLAGQLSAFTAAMRSRGNEERAS